MFSTLHKDYLCDQQTNKTISVKSLIVTTSFGGVWSVLQNKNKWLKTTYTNIINVKSAQFLNAWSSKILYFSDTKKKQKLFHLRLKPLTVSKHSQFHSSWTHLHSQHRPRACWCHFRECPRAVLRHKAEWEPVSRELLCGGQSAREGRDRLIRLICLICLFDLII